MYRDPAARPPAYSQGGYEASFGTYTVDPRSHAFTIHVEGALVRGLIGKDLPRAYERTGNLHNRGGFAMQTAPLPQLQVFLAVARHRSFSGAARELGVSTSAVSQAVKQLEDQLRIVLLTRTTRAVAPTEVGQRLIEAAGPAMKQAVDALASASAQPGEVVGRVKVSVSRMLDQRRLELPVSAN